MSDSIIVRVTLGSYDVVHPSEKQTQVYVQIPEVARASWLLPEDHFHFSQREPWPNVVDSAQEYYERRGTVSDSKSAAARAAVVKWLADDANHDAMRAAWELDEARRHPVARKLLRDKEQLTAELEQRARDLADIAGERDKLRDRVTELEAAPPTVPAAYELATRAHLGAQLREILDRCAKRAQQAEMPRRRDLIARGMGLLSALHLVEEGSANNTEQDGEFAGYDEDADPPGGFPDAPIPYTDPAGYPMETLLARRGVRPASKADGITRRIAPVQALREDKPSDLRAEDTADILTLADAQHVDATYNPTFQTIELELTATRKQWSQWMHALDVDLARTTNRGSCVTSHATWRGIHVVIRCWLVQPTDNAEAGDV